MEPETTVFAIPTYRLRDVAEAIEAYDANFWRNGHAVKLMVFDDASVANHEKYYSLLEGTRTVNELFYVGPREKEEFLAILYRKLRDRKLESLVKNLFRPSYGGNRNCTLMWTLGKFLISSDDDMRPEALIEDSPESLGDDEMCRGKLYRADEKKGYARKSFDLLEAFDEVLGRKVSQVPPNYEKGDFLVDTSMDLETNTTREFTRDNALLLQRGKLSRDAQVKIAQTFRTGTNDIDALDYVAMFLDNAHQLDPQELNDRYVLVNFRPVVTGKNWRIDCGVAGYDNRLGLPPFFPTRLRFEDYIYRLWVQQAGLASAHVDAAQNHTKNNYMRNPLAMEVFNEELCSLLKKKIKDSVYHRDDLTIRFHYQGRGDPAGLRGNSRPDCRRACAGARRRAGHGPGRGPPPGPPALRRQPLQGILRLRAGLLPTKRQPHRGRRHQPDPCLARNLADAGGNLLLLQRQEATAADQGEEQAAGNPPLGAAR